MYMKFKKLVTLIAITLIPISTPAIGEMDSMTSSAISLVSPAILVSGSVLLVHASGAAVITAIKPVGKSVLVSLKSATDGSIATVKFSGKAVGASALTVGETIKVVAGAAGSMLVYSGEILAVIPNTLGQSLLHQSTH